MNKLFSLKRILLFICVIIGLYLAVCFSVYFSGYYFSSCWVYISFWLISYMCGRTYCAAAKTEAVNRAIIETRLVLLTLMGGVVAGVTGYFTYIPDNNHDLSAMWNTLLLYLICSAVYVAVMRLTFKAPHPNIKGIWTVKTAAAAAIIIVYAFVTTELFIVKGAAANTIPFLVMQFLNTVALMALLIYLTSVILPHEEVVVKKDDD